MKNPLMSTFLSSANRMANTVRSHATGVARREAARNVVWFTRAWTHALSTLAKPRRKKKTPK